MNPRQRRGVLFVVLAALGMIGVFVAISSYVSDVRSETDPKIEILRLTEAVEVDQPVGEEMVETVEVPERYVPDSALVDSGSALGRVSTSDLEAGTYLQQGMLVIPPTGKAKEREISILVDAETGVAGRINPGDLVDIIATFPETEIALQQSRFQIQQAEIVAVGLPEQVQEEAAGGTLQTSAVVPVTFALSRDDALKIAFAESFAQDVRLALLPQPDSPETPRGRESFQIGPDGGVFTGDPPPEAPPE